MSKKEIPLLSDKLLKVAAIAENSDAPVMKSWVARHVDSEELKQGIFDEEKLIDVVTEMVGDTEDFLFVPEIVEILQSTLEKIRLSMDEYLLFGLRGQKNRLEQKLKSSEMKDLDKKIKNLKRYLKFSEDELASLNSNEGQAKLKASYDLRIAKLKANLIREAKISRGLAKYTQLAGMRAKEQLVLQELTASFFKRIQELEEKVCALKVELSVAEARSEIRIKLEESLARTGLRLKELESTQVESVEEANNISVEAIRIKEKVGHEYVPKFKSKRERDNIPTVAEQQKQLEYLAVSREAEAALDIQRLSEIVEYARATTDRIRVLVPKDVQRHFKKQWTDVFDLLGYQGELLFVHYQALDCSSDTKSAVVIPSRMHTHSNIWDKSRFEKTIVTKIPSPKQILSFIEAAKGDL